MNELKQLMNDTLVATMPASLKRAIDTALQAGVSKKEVLRRVKAQAGERLTLDAVRAYLATQ